MRTLFICRQRGLRLSTATASITLLWRQHGHVVGCDHSVSRRPTALAPFFVRTLPDPLIGPVPVNSSWQAKDEQAYDISQFRIDWATQQVICPLGKISASWTTRCDRWDNPVISVKFAYKDCRHCDGRPRCAKAKTNPRHMTLKPEREHEALQALRQQRRTPAWKAHYDKRVGIEGTLSQGFRAFGLRHCRYVGLAKTRLQHLATAAAINIHRLAAWLDGRPHAQTRISRFAALAA